MRRKLVVGNWKMHGSLAANAELLAGIRTAEPFVCEAAVCVPFPYLPACVLALQGSHIALGAQDCSAHDHGAYTARGIHGQSIYIDPAAEMVITRFASHPLGANVNLDPTSLPAYHAVAKHLRGTA